MPYTHLQYVAYVLNTGPARPDGANPYYPGLEDANGVRDDIRARCALVSRALETALGASLAGADTLKVFMMPELAFRGPRGAYTMDEVQTLIAMLRQLVSDDLWNDWLFVFGSIVASCAADGDTDDQKTSVCNLSFVKRGGGSHRSSDFSWVILKEFVSDIDFIHATQLRWGEAPATTLLWDNVRRLPADGRGVGMENQRLPIDGAGIFVSDDICFGMEICKDHRARRIGTSPQLPGQAAIQVQLLPGCRLAVAPQHLIAGIPGAAFHCDGYGSGAQLVQRDAGGSSYPNSVSLRVDGADLEVAGAAVPVPVATLYAGSMPSPPIDQGVRPQGEAGSEAGAIVVYDPAPVPARTIVPGSTVALTRRDRHVQIDFQLAYSVEGVFIGAGFSISSDRFRFSVAADLLPATLSAIDSEGHGGTIELRYTAGGDGYDYGITCTSSLPGFFQDGTIIQFYAKPAEHRNPDGSPADAPRMAASQW